MVQNVPPEDAPTPQRLRRTHSSPTVIEMLKKLSLASILRKNKKIETANDERSLKTMAHVEDPEGHPQPGSEMASLVTIDSANMKLLRIPSYFSTLREWIYLSLAQELAEAELKEKLKRKAASDTDTQSPEETLRTKWRCMDGSNLVEKVAGVYSPLEFAQSLFDTELHVSVPLPFFLNKNLQILIDEASTLPTLKSNPLPGESKGVYILDIEKLADRFGRELSITCSQWSEAALNMFKFQQARDAQGDSGEHGAWYDEHFNFFNVQRQRDELYDAWKSVELRFRKEHRSEKTRFKLDHHEDAFRDARNAHQLKQEILALFPAQAPKFPQNNNRGTSGNYNKSFSKPPSRFQASSQPFSSGSGRSSSSTSNCLICTERGHTVFFHQNSPTASKFLGGKPAWSKCTSRGLVTPDNQPLCILWNVRGNRSNCSHPKDERAHMCSFCGSKDHHALSWVCRTNPVSP